MVSRIISLLLGIFFIAEWTYFCMFV